MEKRCSNCNGSLRLSSDKTKLVCDFCESEFYIEKYPQVEGTVTNTYEPDAQNSSDKTYIMTIEDVFSITGRGTVVVGVIKNGVIKTNDNVIINNKIFIIASIEMNRKLLNSASAGMAVGILLKGATKDDFRKGDCIYKEGVTPTSSTSANMPKTPDDIARELLNAGYQNEKIKAIKILRERTGLGLAEAKDVIDRVFASAGYGTYTPAQAQKSGGCYVATCVYGSYDCPQVWILRRYRDLALSKTRYGRLFIKIYYAISPTLVKWFGKTNWFKRLWKSTLDNIVTKLQKQGYEDTQYEDKIF